MKKKNIVIWFIGLSLLMLSCSQTRETALERGTIPAWKDATNKLRAEKDKAFKTSDESPMAGIGRFNLSAEEAAFISITDDALRLSKAKTEKSVCSLFYENDTWNWKNVSELIPLDGKDKEISEGVISDSIIFRYGRFSFRVYPLQKRMVVIVFDKQREMLTRFKGLLYYAPDEEYAVNAKVELIEKTEEFKILTSRNEEKIYYRHAFFKFRISGKDCVLTAFRSTEDPAKAEYLFVPFRDLTSGVETYGAARYLDLDMPIKETVLLDFNKAYNPLCNYSDGYNCPMAPAENALEVEIKAGEKTYPH